MKPDFRLRSNVGEQQRAARRFNCVDHLGQQPRADVPGPREAFDFAGAKRFDVDALVVLALNQPAGAMVRAQQHVHGLVEIAQRGGQPPRPQRR